MTSSRAEPAAAAAAQLPFHLKEIPPRPHEISYLVSHNAKNLSDYNKLQFKLSRELNKFNFISLKLAVLVRKSRDGKNGAIP